MRVKITGADAQLSGVLFSQMVYPNSYVPVRVVGGTIICPVVSSIRIQGIRSYPPVKVTVTSLGVGIAPENESLVRISILPVFEFMRVGKSGFAEISVTVGAVGVVGSSIARAIGANTRILLTLVLSNS